ncbi:MAG: hypothetical protein R3261_14030, partial [Alphaproteobacteria bacterium]|nr:hypothetical protein [Alphaproteobacteria bacterium]
MLTPISNKGLVMGLLSVGALSKIIRILPYVVMFFLAAWLSRKEQFLVGSDFSSAIPILPYLFAFFGAVFAWNFKVSTSVIGFAILIANYWVLMNLLPYGYSSDAFGQVLFAGIAILTPLNFFLLDLADEKGVVSRSGVFRIAIVAIQYILLLGITYFVVGPAKDKVAHVLNFPIFSNILGEWSGLPEISILLHICAVTVPACRFMISSDPRHLGWV